MTRDDNADVEEFRKAYTDDAFTFLKEESKLVNVIMELTNNQNSEAVAQSVRGFTIKLYTILHMKKKEQIKALQAKVEEQQTELIECTHIIMDLRMQKLIEPANYREELKKLKDENEELKAKLKNLERWEVITNTSTEVIDILETELRNTTKKYSILEEAFIKIRDIATSL